MRTSKNTIRAGVVGLALIALAGCETTDDTILMNDLTAVGLQLQAQENYRNGNAQRGDLNQAGADYYKREADRQYQEKLRSQPINVNVNINSDNAPAVRISGWGEAIPRYNKKINPNDPYVGKNLDGRNCYRSEEGVTYMVGER